MVATTSDLQARRYQFLLAVNRVNPLVLGSLRTDVLPSAMEKGSKTRNAVRLWAVGKAIAAAEELARTAPQPYSAQVLDAFSSHRSLHSTWSGRPEFNLAPSDPLLCWAEPFGLSEPWIIEVAIETIWEWLFDRKSSGALRWTFFEGSRQRLYSRVRSDANKIAADWGSIRGEWPFAAPDEVLSEMITAAERYPRELKALIYTPPGDADLLLETEIPYELLALAMIQTMGMSLTEVKQRLADDFRGLHDVAAIKMAVHRAARELPVKRVEQRRGRPKKVTAAASAVT